MAAIRGVDRKRAVWWLSGLVLFGLLAMVVWSFLGTFVFGVFIYYGTRPIYEQLEDRVPYPSVAAATSLVLLALPFLLLLGYTLLVGLQEFERVTDQVSVPAVEAYVEPYVDVAGIVQNPQSLLEEPNAVAAISEFLAQAGNYLGFLASALLHLFVMITIAYYLLKDDDRLAAWFRRRFADGDGVFEAYARAVDRDFRNIFFGNLLNALLTAVIGAVAYNLLNVVAPPDLAIPYPTLLGLLTGAASLIPVVGMKLVYFPVVGWLLFLSSSTPRLLWFPAAFAALSFVVVDTIPDLVLRPYVSGRNLHLGMVMLAYVFGPLLFGWYGIFLGPMLLVLVVHFVRLVLPELIAGEPVRPVPMGAAEPEVAPGAAAAASRTPDPDLLEPTVVERPRASGGDAPAGPAENEVGSEPDEADRDGTESAGDGRGD